MKKINLTILAFFFAVAIAGAQEFIGKLYIKGLSNASSIKVDEPVKLFKAFKENKYPIIFNLNAKGEQIILFDMLTTVRKNGEVISKTSRKGWPWLPGDMYLPAEAFDFIPVLQSQSKLNRDGKYELPGDTFEIVLEMAPSNKASGKIEAFKFKVTR